MSKYTDQCKQIEAKIKSNAKPGAKPACVSSSGDLTALAHTLINDIDHEVTVYNKGAVSESGEPMSITKKPAARYRAALKPVLKNMGIDSGELDRINDIEFTKEHAEALMEVAGIVTKDYVSAGRRYTFPITSTDESEMSLCVTDVDEKVTKPNRFVVGPDGKTTTEPTGKTVTTKAHKVMKVRNVAPFWLKSTEE